METSFIFNFQLFVSKILNTYLSLRITNSINWQRFLKSGLVLLFLVSITLSTNAQKIAIYADDLNVSLSGCDTTASRSFSIENIGTDTLVYSCSAGLYNDSLAGVQVAAYQKLSFSSISAVLIGDYLYAALFGSGSIVKYNLKTQQTVETYRVINEPLGLAYDGEYLWVSQNGSSAIYCYDITGNRNDKTITAL